MDTKYKLTMAIALLAWPQTRLVQANTSLALGGAGILATEVEMPLVLQGKTVGSAKLPRGTLCTVLQLNGDKTLVGTRIGQTWIKREDLQAASDAPAQSAIAPPVAPVGTRPSAVTHFAASGSFAHAEARASESGSRSVTGSQSASEPKEKSARSTAGLTSGQPDSPSAPLPVPEFSITVAGSEVTVKRFGRGPRGIILFGHSGSREMKQTVERGIDRFGDLLPEKCSIFLWDYPDASPFDKVQTTIEQYRQEIDSVPGIRMCQYPQSVKTHLELSNIAAGVVEAVRKATGIKHFLLVGNSLGAGIILWDY